MKKVLLAALFTIITAYAYSQACPTCTINTACTASPAAPALCPSTLPDGTINVPYDQDLTFYMPTQFQTSGVTVTLNQITVTGITGTPSGLSFTCSAPSCIYYPSQNPPATERGCVKICGIPTIPGNYTIVVSVVAQVSTPIGPVSQAEQFELPIRINAPPGGNASFSFNPTSACDSACVTFQGLIQDPVKPTTWDWDFGSGQTSTLKNPAVVCFNSPGDNYVTLVTKTYNYVLSSVTFSATDNEWCGDVEEINFFGACQGAPDIFFDYANGSDSYTANWVGNNTSATFSNLNRVLQTPTLSLTFWDDDDVSPNDNLGTAALNVTAPGTINFTTAHGFGNIVITQAVDQTYTDTDTINIFASPIAPTVSLALGNDSICFGDSILLVSSPSTVYQWFKDGEVINGANNDSVWVSGDGSYYVQVIDGNGCSNTNRSDSTTLTILYYPPTPGLYYTNGGKTINTSIFFPNPNYTLQWFYSQVPNAGGLPIPNQNGSSITPSIDGYYYLAAINPLGCATYSDTLFIQIKTGLNENLIGINDVNIYPNPTKGQFTIQMDLLGNENTAIIIRNILGQTVFNENIGKQSGKYARVFDMPLAKGLYMVEVIRPAGSIKHKLIVN